MRNVMGFGHPVISYLQATFRQRMERARATEDRGASAIEWVVIAAVVVGIVLAVGFVISNALTTKAGNVQECIAGASNSSQNCPGGGE
jgi:Flp pilus assembly pilin Flp